MHKNSLSQPIKVAILLMIIIVAVKKQVLAVIAASNKLELPMWTGGVADAAVESMARLRKLTGGKKAVFLGEQFARASGTL